MNLLDSHDVERVPSMIVNPDLLYDHGGNPDKQKILMFVNRIKRKRNSKAYGWSSIYTSGRSSNLLR